MGMSVDLGGLELGVSMTLAKSAEEKARNIDEGAHGAG